MQTMNRTTGAIEYKVIAASAFKVDDGEPLGTISGYLNKTGLIDSGWDKVWPGAFKQTIKDAEARRAQEGGDQLWPLTWGHNTDIIPPGKIVFATENKNGLLIKARLNLDYDLGKDLYSAFRFGNVKGLSMGYHATDIAWSNDAASGHTVRDIKTVDIVEGAAVLFPMNKESYVTNVKSSWQGFSFDDETKEGRELSRRTVQVLRTAATGIEKHVNAIQAHLTAASQNRIAGYPVYSASNDEDYEIASALEAISEILEGKEGRSISAENHAKIATVTQNIMKHVKVLKDMVHEQDDFNRLAGQRIYSSSSDETYEEKEVDPLIAELRALRMSLGTPSERSVESRLDELSTKINVEIMLRNLLASEDE